MTKLVKMNRPNLKNKRMSEFQQTVINLNERKT